MWISQQLQLGSARSSRLSGSLREDESNGVIFDCRGSFPIGAFSSTSKEPSHQIANVPLPQTISWTMAHLRCALQSAWNGDGLGSLGFLDPTCGCRDMWGWIMGMFWAILAHCQAQTQAMPALTLGTVHIPSNDTVPIFSGPSGCGYVTDLRGEKFCASVHFDRPYLRFYYDFDHGT